MSRTVTKKFRFEAAHRLYPYEGKCSKIHGHTYTAEITVESREPWDKNSGMVIDFGILKERVGGFIDDNFDHALFLNFADPLVRCAELSAASRPYLMEGSPTAENLARVLFAAASKALSMQHGPPLTKPLNVRVLSVTVWETPDSFATYSE